MGVLVRQLAIGGGALPVLNFSDSFARPDEPFFVGDNWFPVYTQGGTYTGANLAGAIGVGANQLTFTQNNGLVANCWFIPRLLTINKIIGRNQFSQFTVSAYNVAAQVTFGPGVFANPNGSLAVQGYYLRLFVNAGVLNVRTVYGYAPITSVAGTANQPINVGDVLRLEVRNNGASNNVRMLINGAVIENLTDNTANRPTSGMYGIAWESGTVGGTASIQLYSGGVL